MKKLALSMTVAILFGSAGSAMAAEGGEKEFGDQGTIAFGAATGLDFSYSIISPSQGDSSNLLHFSVLPQIHYFVIDQLSVGGEALFDISKPKNVDATTLYGIGPTVGYNIWLSPELLSLWPQVEFLITHESIPGLTTTTPAGTTTVGGSSTTRLTLGAFVPLEIHPAKHFHFGVGPYFDVDLSASDNADKITRFGLRAEIGGWL